MVLHVQEFATIRDAQAAQREFQFCGTCRGSIKIQVIQGQPSLRCVINFHHHDISNERIGKDNGH